MQIKKAVKEHTHIKKETIINNSHATRVPRDLADLTASMVHAAGRTERSASTLLLLPAFGDDNP